MTDSEFIALAERTLERIEAALEAAVDASDADVDWSHHDGILEIVGEDGRKVIVNRHVPNREIWLAAPGGAFHFRAVDERWQDTRGGAELPVTLASTLADALALTLPPLELPAV